MRKTKGIFIGLIVFLICILGFLYISYIKDTTLKYESFQYEINKDNTISIIKFSGDNKEIFVPNKIKDIEVTEIKENAFSNCSNIKSIYIPENIIRMDKNLFEEFKDIIIYGYEDSYSYDYALENKISFILSKEIVIREFTTDCHSPQLNGNKINLKGNATGGMGDLEYSYEVSKNGLLIWEYDCGNNKKAEWVPIVAGNYDISLIVRDKCNNIMKSSYKFKIKEGMNIVDFRTALDSPQPLNRLITIEASTINSKGLVKYKYVVKKNGVVTWIRDYSEDRKAIWSPKEEGDYTIEVTAVDENKEYCRKSIEFTVKDVIFIDSIKTNKESPQKIGDNIEIEADVKGGKGKLTYIFSIIRENNVIWESGKVTNKKITWIPADVGEYTIKVRVEDEEGNISEKSRDFNITNYLMITSYSTDLISPQLAGTKINIIANAIGTKGSIYYKFTVLNNKNEVWTTEYSKKNRGTWIPRSKGMYEIFVDVTDGKKVIREKIGNYEIT